MDNRTLKFLVGIGSAFAVLGLATSTSQADTVAFDDAWAALGQGGDPATFYQPDLTISGTYFGVVGGNGNGDPGNWNLEGTNGSAFLGSNRIPQSNPTFTFATPLADVSLDVGLPGFNWGIDFLVTAKLGGSTVATEAFNMTSFGDPGPWRTVSFNVPLDSVMVQMTDNPGGGFAFGIDNLVFTPIPEPGAAAMLGLIGIPLVGWLKRRIV